MELHAFSSKLVGLDGKPYGAYKSLVGTAVTLTKGVTFRLDKAQVDPYAPPSLARLVIDRDVLGLPKHLNILAAEDHLARAFHRAVSTERAIGAGRLGQEVLQRTNLVIEENRIEVRFTLALPAAGRRIKGRAANALITRGLKHAADDFVAAARDTPALDAAMDLHTDQEWIRAQLTDRGLVGFIADGSILPRASGDSDLPLTDAVAFSTPETLRVSFDVPSGKTITGMGIPQGVSVIVGGGYHGKSTVLRALERGVYPHIAGDGREWVITDDTATSVRAEDGRSVAGVDISAFISNLPTGEDTTAFSSANASGSTSQATNLVEAVEAGVTTLLIDEDTSATNFMIRDEMMRQLINDDREPITPFVQRVRALYDHEGVSTVLVAGGTGAFFGVADTVIALDDYRLSDVTTRAHDIAVDHPENHRPPAIFGNKTPRIPRQFRPKGKTKPAQAKSRDTIRLGKDFLDLGPALQIVDPAQTTGIAHVLDRFEEIFNGEVSIPEAVTKIEQQINTLGLDSIAPYNGHPGLFARPRRHEISAALNRWRGLRLI